MIRGNSAIRALLARAIDTSGPAPAYLFLGPRGVGKSMVGRWLAARLCCPSPSPPCGTCATCARVWSGNHPDVMVVDRIEGKASIGIDDVRTGIAEVQYRPYEGRYRAWILGEAERLTDEAQSALLKTLEEPPAHLVLVLVAGAEEALLPTVTSRCRILRFGPLDPLEVQAVLAEHGVPAERSAALARLSGGSPGEALALARTEGLWEFREKVLDTVAMLPGADMATALEAASTLEGLKTGLADARADVERALEAMMSWYRDLLCLAAGAEESLVVNAHRLEALRSMAGRVKADAGLRHLVEASEHSRRNVHARLLLQKLCLSLG